MLCKLYGRCQLRVTNPRPLRMMYVHTLLNLSSLLSPEDWQMDVHRIAIAFKTQFLILTSLLLKPCYGYSVISY